MVLKYCRCLYMGVVAAGRVVGGRCVVVAVCVVGVVGVRALLLSVL